MTPSWQKMVRQSLNFGGTDDKLLRALVACRCFDVRGVEDLVTATAAEVARSYQHTAEAPHHFGVDIGGRVVIPADSVWIEWSSGWGALTKPDRHENGGRIWDWVLMRHGDAGGLLYGAKFFEADDGFVFAFTDSNSGQPMGVTEVDPVAVSLASTFIAAIAAINSKATDERPIAPHKGMARIVRQASSGAPRVIQHTTVILRPIVGSRGGAKTLSHPKAYHFCRAHPREIGGGRIARVRAHWRGDPAFGIRLPSYKFASDHEICDQKPTGGKTIKRFEF